MFLPDSQARLVVTTSLPEFANSGDRIPALHSPPIAVCCGARIHSTLKRLCRTTIWSARLRQFLATCSRSARNGRCAGRCRWTWPIAGLWALRPRYLW